MSILVNKKINARNCSYVESAFSLGFLWLTVKAELLLLILAFPYVALLSVGIMASRKKVRCAF